ncbi:uncharacterized protein LOC120163190 [Hibiscus syriacus]|uniref:uncharacterized protein LOC120163190 n=1 Tax=Hibiscus syriacus TaxID=106335 RepID=UPI0019227C2C|nr:uncharacterized protein LOC120163190 [Hibiscus syriacus]
MNPYFLDYLSHSFWILVVFEGYIGLCLLRQRRLEKALRGGERAGLYFFPVRGGWLLYCKASENYVEEGILEWRFALVGSLLVQLRLLVHCKSSRVDVVKSCSDEGQFGRFEFICVFFANSSARDWVLENGPWHVQHKPLFLRKWEPNLKELCFDLICMPIWVQLYNVPLELFSQKGLSYIASTIVKPLHMDSITTSREKLEYARVCVEISVDSRIPEYVDVLLCDGSTIRIRVFVPWKPISCDQCSRFGHSIKYCPQGKKVEQVWRSRGLQDFGCRLLLKGLSNMEVSSAVKNTESSVDVQSEQDILNMEVVVQGCEEEDKVLPNKEVVNKSGSNPPIKRGKGKPIKVGGKNAMGGSKNKFEILSSIDPESLLPAEDSGRRAASLGVAKIVQDLKLKKKEHIEKDFIISAVYGSNDSCTRRKLWNQLNYVGCAIGNLSWLIGGDFNVILKAEESSATVSVVGTYLARKLDRVLMNSNWLDTLLNQSSDHFWAKHAEFLSIVEKSWQSAVVGNPAQALFNKLKRLKGYLRDLNRTCFNDISNRELQALEEAELFFYKLKDKVSWITEGDQGTRFFHSMVTRNRKNNTIRVLYNQAGARLDSFKDMSNEYTLPTGAAEDLCRGVSDMEIRETIWGQENEKAPGPDGYNPFFFKAAWPIIAEDFKAGIRYCFENSFILSAFNTTAIVLVPKIPNPNMVKDYRPISCCTVIYKTVTRILVKRLYDVFPSMILKNQTAFVKGRSIVDNTLLAQELVRGYNRKNISHRCAMKIDFQKAFDSLNWDFIDIVLYALGLPEKFVGWTWACFTKPSYSIVLNDSLVGYYRGSRGVRQGDPLSPYLFILVMNVLSSLLNIAAQQGIFRFHPKYRKIGFTHLCFADDLLIFCKGYLDSIMCVQSVLDMFYSLSGLRLNASKCELYIDGISSALCDDIRETTGFKIEKLPVRYLGIPLVTKKLTEKDCRSLIEKIRDKLNLWVNRHLSFAGRLQLIRAILFSIANYWCRQVMLPRVVIKKIKQLCSRFFWKGADVSAKGARVS